MRLGWFLLTLFLLMAAAHSAWNLRSRTASRPVQDKDRPVEDRITEDPLVCTPDPDSKAPGLPIAETRKPVIKESHGDMRTLVLRLHTLSRIRKLVEPGLSNLQKQRIDARIKKWTGEDQDFRKPVARMTWKEREDWLRGILRPAQSLSLHDRAAGEIRDEWNRIVSIIEAHVHLPGKSVQAIAGSPVIPAALLLAPAHGFDSEALHEELDTRLRPHTGPETVGLLTYWLKYSASTFSP